VDGPVQPARGADESVAHLRYSLRVAETIAQRDLRNDNAEIMRRVEAGESFVITRNGRPIADLTPHGPRRGFTLREQQEHARTLPPVDSTQWYADRATDDEIFGDDRLES
jgi:prevent-host-death family protein